jgi:hypothetical protein
MNAPWNAMQIAQQPARDAYEAVLADVGCTRPARDSLDTRIIQEGRAGTATNGNNGLVTCPQDTPLPTLNSAPAPADSDHDGMPNAFEMHRTILLTATTSRRTATPCWRSI